jgi:hypothetical protein
VTEYTTSDDLCRSVDEFVFHQPHWEVELSNGEIIYQDDNRPGVAEPSAWVRLKNYCTANHLHITQFWLQFRSNRIVIGPANADGYYFVKSVFAIWGDNETIHAYVVGVLMDGKIQGARFKVPEFTLMEHIDREPDFDSPTLIARQLTTGGFAPIME